jgi:hypothetical protein
MKLNWEAIKNGGDVHDCYSYRSKVPGGWLIIFSDEVNDSYGTGLTFLPDSNHNWDGNSLDVDDSDDEEN